MMSPWVLYHDGAGWLSASSVSGPHETVVMYGAVAEVRYDLAETRSIGTLANARRIVYEHGSSAYALVAKLNASEGHHRWRVVRYDTACEMERRQ